MMPRAGRFVAVLLAALALVSVARAESACVSPLTGLGAADRPFTRLHLLAPENGPELFLYGDYGRPWVLRGDTLQRWEGEVWPHYPNARPAVNTADGRHFLPVREAGNTTLLVRQMGAARYETLLTAPYRDIWVDPATARIFARDGDELLEWSGDGWDASPLMLRSDGTPGLYSPDFGRVQYFSALGGWMALQDGTLWLRLDSDADWEKITTVQTWRRYVDGRAPELFFDREDNLAVLRIDVAALVFDLSGPRAEFLYQHMIHKGSVAQAGQGRVLLELLSVKRDAGWFEQAPALRMITRDGAWPVPGAPLPPAEDHSGESLPPGPPVYALHPLGAGVLVGDESSVWLFDGRTMLAMPGLSAAFPDGAPEIVETPGGNFLVGNGVYRWPGGDMAEPVTAPDGSVPERVLVSGDTLAFIAGDPEQDAGIWLSTDGETLYPVPLDAAARLDLLAPVPGRPAFFAEIDSEPVLISQCERDGRE